MKNPSKAAEISPIETAVAPLKTDAIARADKDARELIANIEKRLAEKDHDLEQYAPYPNARMPRPLYMKALNHCKLVESLTCDDESRNSPYRRMHEPNFVKISEGRAQIFIDRCKEMAGLQYDSFVAKLVAKIGTVQAAALTGNHVWSYSVLRVTRFDGSVERWQTQQIVNVSKLGLLFNQWPTRKVK